MEENKYWTSKVEVFGDLTLEELKGELNKFSKENFVIATQTHYLGHGFYSAVVYFKVPPEGEKRW